MKIPDSSETEKKLGQLEAANWHRIEHLDFMARMFSHNLRSPVAGMKMLFALLEKVDEKEKEEVLANLQEASSMLFGMIDDLATVLMDMRQLSLPPEVVSVQKVIDEVLGEIQPSDLKNPASVKVDLQLPEIRYNRQHLKVILNELLTNCLKFAKVDTSAQVVVRTYRDKERVMLSVEDKGLGIDLEIFAKDVFKMYKPLQYKSTNIEGMGLFRVKNIVEINGGKVSLESEPEEGTKVLMELYRE